MQNNLLSPLLLTSISSPSPCIDKISKNQLLSSFATSFKSLPLPLTSSSPSSDCLLPFSSSAAQLLPLSPSSPPLISIPASIIPKTGCPPPAYSWTLSLGSINKLHSPKIVFNLCNTLLQLKRKSMQ